MITNAKLLKHNPEILAEFYERNLYKIYEKKILKSLFF